MRGRETRGRQYVRLIVYWRGIAPATPPAGFVATDPTSPGYSWGAIDAVVEAAESAGLTPILDILLPPAWAYETPPTGVNGGSPKVADLGDFATALATHYDDPTPGAPTAHVFQVWNEPNLSLDLSPVDARSYRAMVNAVADSVHAVDPTNLVVAGGLDPFGHKKTKHQEWYSLRPARLHAVPAVRLEGKPSACDVRPTDPLRCLVAPSVYVRRSVRARKAPR